MNLSEIISDILVNPIIPDIRPKMTAHPSAASIKKEDGTIEGGCLRSEYYRIKGYECTQPITPMQQMKFRLGDKAHELITDALSQAKILDGDECQIWVPEYKISGRADAIVSRSDDENKIGVEIKSCWGYHGRKKTIFPYKGIMEPKINHVLQCMVYLDFYSRFGMEEWKLFYFSRDNGDFNEHTIRFVPNGEDKFVEIKSGYDGSYLQYPYLIMSKIYDRYREFWEHVDSETIPSRDYRIQYDKESLKTMAQNGDLNKKDMEKVEKDRFVEKGDWNCAYCNYKNLCWDGADLDQLWNGE